MNWINKYFKIFSYNISILLLIFLFIYFITIIFNRFSNPVSQDNRFNLINYKNIDWAKTHFEEFSKLNTEYKDFYGWRRSNFEGQTITINKNGLRKTIVKDSNKFSDFSVLFFGGSTMWGTGSNDQNTIPSLFSQLNNVNAINYGESGYTSIQSLNYLNTLLIKEDLNLKNKLVVFYDGVNNVSDNCLSYNKGLETARELQISQFINQPKVTNFSYYIKPLLLIYDSIINSQNKNKFVNQDFRDCDNEILKADLVANNLVNTWSVAKNIIETKGGKFIAILQPVIYVGDFKKDHLENKIDYDLEENFKIVYKLIKSKANYKLGESFIDLTYALDNKDYYFIDYCHLSPNGNLLIVNQLTNVLKNFKYFESWLRG